MMHFVEGAIAREGERRLLVASALPPGLTTASSRHPPASAPLPLPGAADAQRYAALDTTRDSPCDDRDRP
jgi:hypothetical protein